MAVEQIHPNDPGQIKSQEFYPIVGPAVEKIDLLVPSFGPKLMSVVAEIMGTQGVKMARIAFSHEGEDGQKQTLEVVLSDPPGNGGQLSVEVAGDWTVRPDIPRGLPLLASYDGVFFRKLKPEDPEPLAKEGDKIEPDQPIGVAGAGKGNYWLLPLPPRDFPDGGTITKFVATSGQDVKANSSILCYVEKH